MVEDCTKRCIVANSGKRPKTTGCKVGFNIFLGTIMKEDSLLFFSQPSENCFSTELNKLAFIREGIKPRNTPSIRIESSDWKGDLNAVVVPLLD